MSKTVEISQYIIVKKNDRWSRGGYYKSRMTTTTPTVYANEVAVKVVLSLPEALFEKPQLKATIKIPQSAVSKPEIEAETIDNVQDIIKQNLGFDVRLEVVSEPKEEENGN